MPHDLLDDVHDLRRGRLRPPPVLEGDEAPPDDVSPKLERDCRACGSLAGFDCVNRNGHRRVSHRTR